MMMRTITREQFFEEWREECRAFLRRGCSGFGSRLLDQVRRGTLVVADRDFRLGEEHAKRARKNAVKWRLTAGST